MKLAEDLTAHIKLQLTVSHVVEAISCNDKHGVDVTTEKADTVAESLLRRRVVNHDKILMLFERVHHALNRLRTGAEARMEAVVSSDAVALCQLREIVKSGKQIFHLSIFFREFSTELLSLTRLSVKFGERTPAVGLLDQLLFCHVAIGERSYLSIDRLKNRDIRDVAIAVNLAEEMTEGERHDVFDVCVPCQRRETFSRRERDIVGAREIRSAVKERGKLVDVLLIVRAVEELILLLYAQIVAEGYYPFSHRVLLQQRMDSRQPLNNIQPIIHSLGTVHPIKLLEERAYLPRLKVKNLIAALVIWIIHTLPSEAVFLDHLNARKPYEHVSLNDRHVGEGCKQIKHISQLLLRQFAPRARSRELYIPNR
nr:MAG TPA: hypothetical protein [Caudoviricetes sp.]